MNKREFIEAYVISSIQACASAGSLLKVEEIVDEAVEAWVCINAAEPIDENSESASAAKLRRAARVVT